MLRFRGSVQVVGGLLVQSRLQFHSSVKNAAASVFRMPAMSPTMTEGGILNWSLKAGDEFSAGDVMLEIETDKAAIDVEAQDDGIMWEILVEEGAKGIPVGKPIALLAEVGDDLSTLTKPALEEASSDKKAETEAPKPAATSKAEKKPEAAAPAKSSSTESTSLLVKANPNQTLFPSVHLLLESKGISSEEAFEKIPASGPQGRLLKGDVLAYLGLINHGDVVSVAEFIHKREKLELPKFGESVLSIENDSAEARPAEESKQVEIKKPENILTYSFSTQIPSEVTKDAFRDATESTIYGSVREAYSRKFPQYARSPTASSTATSDDLFDDLLTPSVTKPRFQIYDVKYNFANTPSATSFSFDDILSVTNDPKPVEKRSTIVDVTFKLKFDNKLLDAKQLVQFFDESLGSHIPADRLTVSK